MCRRFFRSFLHSMMSLWRLRGEHFEPGESAPVFSGIARARQAQAREDRLQAADEAAYLRRMAAVKKSASSVKTSWKTDVAVERKKRQIQNAQIGTQAARAAKTPCVLIRCRLAWEAGRIELARSGAANRRTRAGAGAFCVSAVMLVFGQAGLRVARPPAAVSMQPGSSREGKGQDKAAGSARTRVHWSEAALRFAMRELFSAGSQQAV